MKSCPDIDSHKVTISRAQTSLIRNNEIMKKRTLWKTVLILFMVLVCYFISKAVSFCFRYRHFSVAHCFGIRIAQLV